MKFRNGPAAVTGDERCIKPLVTDAYREGAVSRMIRESEDLPAGKMFQPSWKNGRNLAVDKLGNPRTLKGPGFLFHGLKFLIVFILMFAIGVATTACGFTKFFSERVYAVYKEGA